MKIMSLALRRTPFLCRLLFTGALALLPIAAKAQCTNWDASGVWEIRQRGQDNTIKLTLEQTGRVLIGKAEAIPNRSSAFDDVVFATGRVDGTIDGDRFSVQIFWPKNLTGVYNATVLPSGRLDGVTYDKNHPNISQTWNSQNPLKCAPPVVISQPSPPRPKPIKSSGKAKTSPPTAAPPAPMKVPGIIATQAFFPTLGSPTGTVGLSWDGGPDHPYAEVWVKVNDGPETFVVELGKGGRSITVQRGTLYEYILTDAGTTLATVRFVAN